MADKMMRIAGQGNDGLAHAIKTDKITLLNTVAYTPEGSPYTLANGESLELLGRTEVAEFRKLVVLAAFTGPTSLEITTRFTATGYNAVLDEQVDITSLKTGRNKQVIEVVTDVVQTVSMKNVSGSNKTLILATVYGMR